jgi:hypothetical protein
MLVSLIALAIALVTQWLSRVHTDNLGQNTFTLISRACLIFSLVVAPWSLKCLIVATVFLLPRCLRSNSNELPQCSQQCIARSSCPHPHV